MTSSNTSYFIASVFRQFLRILSASIIPALGGLAHGLPGKAKFQTASPPLAGWDAGFTL